MPETATSTVATRVPEEFHKLTLTVPAVAEVRRNLTPVRLIACIAWKRVPTLISPVPVNSLYAADRVTLDHGDGAAPGVAGGVCGSKP